MFSKMRLGTKVVLGFILVLSFTLVCGIVGAIQLSNVNDLLNNMYDNNLVPIADVANANLQAVYQNRSVYDLVIAEDKAEMDGIKKTLTDCEMKMKTLLDKYRKTDISEKEKDTLAKFDLAWPKYQSTVDKVISLSYDGKNKEAIELLNGEATTAFDAADDLLSDLVTINQDLGKAAYAESDAAYDNARNFIVGIIATCAVLGILVAVMLTRSITRPLRELFKGLKSFSTAELQQTGQDFNRIIAGLTESVGQVNDAAGQVASASQQLAEGASEQASSLEETSSALEEMAAMTRTNAANAKEANNLASQARTAANDGDTTMGAISESSSQISKIIKVIEEIAFQTNLLALNAAVEAARAGEHGKGFAVVADEVRNLAQRAAQAAKETTGLIEDSVNRSKQGTEAIQAIVGNVGKLTDLIDGIAKASSEQAQGVDQVNMAVSQMDKVTQQNAAGAEESASAAEELSAQAEAVNGLVHELIVLVEGNQGGTHGKMTHIKPKANKQTHKPPASHFAEQKQKQVQSAAIKPAKQTELAALTEGDMKDF